MKAQDIVIALKLTVLASKAWTQSTIGYELCISQAEVNTAIKRLLSAKLLCQLANKKIIPNFDALEEFLIHGLKYTFPPIIGEITRGIPTSYGAPIFENLIRLGSELVPVWPYAEGTHKGYALLPLYPNQPKAVALHSDPKLYDLLCLVDAIRSGRAREQKLASELLNQKLKEYIDVSSK